MADARVGLRWTGEGLQFQGGDPKGPQSAVDGDGRSAPSPVTTLLLSLGGCMAADVVDITSKMRVKLDRLELDVEGDRAPTPPRRFLNIRLRFRAGGVEPSDHDKVRRALALSHETYCSVLHSLRGDVDVTSELEFS